ncbi:hypothetical protein ABVT39_017673 [Epinephelus coioides]
MQHIQWPQPNYDSDDDDDDRIPLEKVSLVTGFLRKFIQEVSQITVRSLSLLLDDSIKICKCSKYMISYISYAT